jgi:hypothetical protein
MPQLRFIHDASWTAVHLDLLRAVEIVIVWIKGFGGLRPARNALG